MTTELDKTNGRGSAPVAGPDPSLAALDERPQRWGILPTSSFWKRKDLPPAVKSVPSGVLAAVLSFSAFLVYELSGLLWAQIIIVAGGVVGYFLFYGLLERYVRRRLAERRAEAAKGELPPGHSE